jgi:hypothetical protein
MGRELNRDALRGVMVLLAMTTGCLAPPDADVGVDAVRAAPVPTRSDPDTVGRWCDDNHGGNTRSLGGPTNPCVRMCATVQGNRDAARSAIITGMIQLSQDFSLSTDVRRCIASFGGNADLIYNQIRGMTSDPFCREHPVTCGLGLASTALCTVSSCMPPTMPYGRAVSAVCAFAPILVNAWERGQYFSMCVQHIQNENSVPINPGQGCMCERQEMRGSFGRYTACGPQQTWAQVGTAEANCRNRDGDYLPLASEVCRADGASDGGTFYRYTNCHFVAAPNTEWCEFRQRFLDRATNLQAGEPSACVCRRDEVAREGLLGSRVCATAQANMGTRLGAQACAANNGRQSAWLPLASPACGAANGSTWYRYSDCALVEPSSPRWTASGLPAVLRPPVSLVGAPGCPGDPAATWPEPQRPLPAPTTPGGSAPGGAMSPRITSCMSHYDGNVYGLGACVESWLDDNVWYQCSSTGWAQTTGNGASSSSGPEGPCTQRVPRT